MNGYTRREALRRSVIPLVAITGTGGLAAAAAGAGAPKSGAEVAFATVLAASESSLDVQMDGAQVLTMPIRQIGGTDTARRAGNPFRAREWVVLDLDAEGNVVGVEPLSDSVAGAVERRDGDRFSVAGETFLIDEWSLARVGEGDDATVVPLSETALGAGTEVILLVRRGSSRAARRVAAAFVVDRLPAESAEAGVSP